jgi:hypothetical protein
VRRLEGAKRHLLRDQLVGVVANALYYNPVLALQALQQQGRTQTFFATWFQVCALAFLLCTALPMPAGLSAELHFFSHPPCIHHHCACQVCR